MFELTGVLAMEHALGTLARESSERFGAAIYHEAERIMARSKEDFVPVDTGALKASGIVRPPTESGHVLTVAMIYGGPSVPYAVVQHETPWFHHPVGQWKYLEQPMMEAVDGMARRLAADMHL